MLLKRLCTINYPKDIEILGYIYPQDIEILGWGPPRPVVPHGEKVPL